MKNIVPMTGVFFFTLFAFLAVNTVAQSTDSVSTPKTSLEQGICAFKNKNYPLAQMEFEKALQQDPDNKLLMLFRARAIYFQYDRKVQTAANIVRARSAIDAYLKVLSVDPSDTEASMLIADLYEQIDRDKLPEIAADETLPKQVRTSLYLKLAAGSNTCAMDVTDVSKTEVNQGGGRIFRYHMPKNANDFTRAQGCASEGIEFVDKALALEPHDESVWSYKASLSIQMSRLAEMQQRPAEKTRFDKQAELARIEFRKIADEVTARRQQADQEERQRSAKQQMTPDEGAVAIAKFITTGRLRKVVRIDENSIDSPVESLLVAPVADDQDINQQPKAANPPPTPVVWKTFTAPDGGFSAVLPSEIDIKAKSYIATAAGKTYFVTYVDIPPKPPATVDQMMAAQAWGLADSICNFSLMANANCDVRLSKKISLGAYPGVEYAVSEDNCSKVFPGLIRVYATPNRVYALAAVGGDENDAGISKFLKSFTVQK